MIGEALGLSLGHSALAPSGHPIWLDMARRSARALMALERRGVTTQDILTDAAIHNAMVTHAAFGGSTNLILHLPAIAHAAGLRRPTARDWTDVNRRVPRIVDALPNGPRHHPTIQVFLAGGVPEVMLHLRRAGLLETQALTVSGVTLGEQLDDWEASERRQRLRAGLHSRDGVDPDDVILSPEVAASAGLTSTVCFPAGNLAPDGAVIKSTAIDPSVLSADGVYRFTGPARVFSHRAIGDGGDQERRDSGQVTSSCSSVAGRWARGWKRPISSRLRCAICRSASTSRSSPTRASAACQPARASATCRQKRSPAVRSASCATAT